MAVISPDEVASSIGARAPDNLVLGFAPAFFATGGKVHLPDNTVVTGETLYLSVTSKRLLSQPQLQAVIGHELSHFAGDDTSFSLRFMPIYQRLFDSMMASHAVRGYASLTAIPSRVILREAFLSFARAERRISRAREIAADRAGAVAASASDMITAIQLVEHSTRLWPLVVQESIDAINTGATPPILGERLESLASTQNAASHDANQSPTGQLSDTHPTLAARAQALGVQVCSAGPQACPQDIPRATALIDRADELEAALGCLLRNALLASGAARPPRDPDRPNYLERKRLQRIRQAEARKRRAEAVAVEQQV